MHKREERKSDGRLLIYYTFETSAGTTAVTSAEASGETSVGQSVSPVPLPATKRERVCEKPEQGKEDQHEQSA